jgi:hypothetical protein
MQTNEFWGAHAAGVLHSATGRMFVHMKFKVADCDPIKALGCILTRSCSRRL